MTSPAPAPRPAKQPGPTLLGWGVPRRSGRGRSALWLGVVGVCAGLVGCPLFPEGGCFVDRDCDEGYACDARVGVCVPATPPPRACSAPSDCEVNETCSRRGVCAPGDCTFSGCVTGYRCASPDGVWTCVPEVALGGAGGVGGASASD